MTTPDRLDLSDGGNPLTIIDASRVSGLSVELLCRLISRQELETVAGGPPWQVRIARASLLRLLAENVVGWDPTDPHTIFLVSPGAMRPSDAAKKYKTPRRTLTGLMRRHCLPYVEIDGERVIPSGALLSLAPRERRGDVAGDEGGIGRPPSGRTIVFDLPDGTAVVRLSPYLARLVEHFRGAT